MQFHALLLAAILPLKVNSYLNSSLHHDDISFCDCYLPILLQSDCKTVHFICDSKSICPYHGFKLIAQTTWTFSADETLVLASDRKDVCVISAEDVPRMIDLLKRFRKCSRANVIFSFPVYKDDEILIQEIFDVAWTLGIVDTVAVVQDNDTCYSYSYFPFKENSKCVDTTPVMISSWKRGSLCTSNTSDSFFPANKISNLHSCRLVFEVSVFKRNVHVLNVVWYPLIAFFLRAMNATGEVFFPFHPGKFPGRRGNSTDVLMAGKFLITPPRTSVFVIPTYMEGSRDIIAIPHRPVSGIPWFRITDELSPTVWYGVATAFTVSVAVLCIIVKNSKDIGYAPFFVFQALLNNPCRWNFVPWYGRVYFMSFVWFSLVLCATYLSKLLSQLTVPLTKETINSIEDLVASGIPIHAVKNNRDYITQALDSRPEYWPLKDVIRFVNLSYYTLFERVRHDIGYICNFDDFGDLLPDMSHHILPGVGYDTHRTRVMLPKPSPYEQLFNMAVLRIFEAGGFGFVERREHLAKAFKKSEHLTSRRGGVSLGLESLSPVFVMGFIGWLISFIAFILELLTSWLSFNTQ